MHPPLEVKVSGDFACFTRPEMKVERVSYPVMTPSAARGVLEAIFWKPEFSWMVEEIRVLRPIRHFSILRNEVNSVASDRAAKGWMKNGGGFFSDEDRAQRHTLGLRDVSYIIRSRIRLRSHATDNPAKYRVQFRRRVQRGQCFQQPYLGCREFVARFEPPTGEEKSIEFSDELGLMLFDMNYDEQGRGEPIFFRAKIDGGVVHVPESLYQSGGRRCS